VREERRAPSVHGAVKFALILLALLGGLWTTRSLPGGSSRSWGDPNVHATFFEDGSPRSQATLRQGRFHGPARTWHRGHRLASQGEYVHGERQGPWLFRHPDGRPDEALSGFYENGVRVAPLGAQPSVDDASDARPSSS
jgi:hypothetical protein